MNGICELYKTYSELKESHIYPKFVINYTKKTGSKFLRKLEEPNKRMQDGIKLHLLSKKAEQKFSLREKWFAENIFVPYLKGQTELKYTEELFFFTISFLWRIIVLELKTSKNLKTTWYYDQIIKTEKEWRLFLSKGIFPKNYNKTYLFFTDRIKENNSGLKGVDFYLTRVMDATIVSNKSENFLAIYGKFNKFIFWGNIVNFGNEEKLNEVEINPIKGKFRIPQNLDYFPINSFLGNRIKGISNFPSPNEKQQKKIEEEILKNIETFWETDAGQSIYNDNFNLNN